MDIGLGLGAELMRHRASATTRGNFLPNLGKTLTHHQVIPAVTALRVANQVRTDIKTGFNASGMSGHPRIPNSAKTASKLVAQVSHFDARKLMNSSLTDHLKYTPQSKSLISR
tara:strand:+ start:2209 stop:2547 length:339 start_codon:yes stop_codon:yes gene_type:complete